MKKKLRISNGLLILFLVWSCQVYRPIEKVTSPSDPKLSKTENISKQLAELEEGDEISMTLDNEIKHNLIFKSVFSDTLIAEFQKPKKGIPIKIPLDRIQEVKVEEFNLPITLLVFGITFLASWAVVSAQTFNYTW